ncbi:MAG: CHASE sensor domain-containing protein, partial [Nitrospirales bacterium]|nr:CHASE sensor domain-containing protein [Nitrospirales bacterium]
MSTLRDISIKQKLILIIMLTSVIALTLASAGFIIGEAFTFRDSMARNLSTMADVIVANSTAALVFKDQASAEETLSALGAVRSIVTAGIYAKDGPVFARYLRRDAAKDHPLPVHPEDGYRFEGGHLLLFRPIIYDGERIGTVYLQSDMQELNTRLKLYVGIVALVLLASSIAAYLLSSKLQHVVSGPILRLAKTMRIVSSEKDYSVRATKHSQDEIGVLIDGFNDMLAQIQTRDAALQRARNELEKRVEERTKSLEQANAALREQIQERMRVEEERARLLKEVQGSHARLQYLSSRMLEVQEEERRRLARE